MKTKAFYLLTIIFFSASLWFAACQSPPVQPPPPQPSQDVVEVEEAAFIPEYELPPPEEGLPISSFREVWAYLIAGEEDTLKQNFPLSDVGYFGAEVDSYGRLINVPDVKKISYYRGRTHLVVACNGTALTHFVLLEGRAERQALIRDLLEAANPFDGLQIDFENVPARDGEAFLSFLKELRAGLKDKVFTVALRARTRTIQNDVFDYATIKPIVDRILVMAYDEHWSTSAPGPIASLPWCRNVARYALEVIGEEKLIMGLPLYGRTWGNINPNRAFFYSGIERIHREYGSPEIRREEGIPTYIYETPLRVTVYYEDNYSLATRMDMYSKMGVSSVGFWRLGMESPTFWSLVKSE